MLTYLLNSGAQALADQAADGVNKLTIKRFEVGDSVSFTFDASVLTAQGNIFVAKTASSILYSNISDTEALLTCLVTHDDPTDDIGNIVLFVDLNGVEYPFLLARPQDNIDNIKLESAVHKVGMTLDVHIFLNIPDLLTRFDFSALTQKTISWLTVTGPELLPAPFNDTRDIVQIGTHPETNRPAFVFNRSNQWFGCPFMFALDDPNYFQFSGGTAGDEYQA